MPGPRLINCFPEEQERLARAVVTANAILQAGMCGLSGLEGLRNTMYDLLNRFPELIVRCIDCADLPLEGFTPHRGRGEIVLCRNLLLGPQDRINAVFFHEMVHAAGGTELDGEGLEGHCFSRGATEPGSSDYRVFRVLPSRGGYYLGAFLMWNPSTGHVFVRGPGDQPGAALNVRFLEPR